MIERILRPSVVAPLPDPPAGMFDVAYAVTANGTLALLRADCDVHGNLRRTQSMWDFRQEFDKGVRARLSVFDGKLESTAFEFQLESPVPMLDQLPDGHWVIADRRCRFDEKNGRLLSPKGDLVRRFCLGDAIAHLQCDASGGIWVGYFDEAISKEFNGLIKFDSHGEMLWRSNSNNADDIIDCYALNVSGSNAWTYYYTDFPIVEVDATGRTRIWECPVRAANALAVEGDVALLAGGYEEDRNRVVLVALTEGTAQIIEPD
jgi:hypothetical protein